MHELTPDMISSIAAKLFQQLPAEAPVPSPAIAPSHAAPMPTHPPIGLAGGAFPSIAAPSVPSGPSPTVAPPPMSVPAVPEAAPQNDGIRSFVDRIRNGEAPVGGSGLCGNLTGFHFPAQLTPVKTPAVYASRPFDLVAIRRDFPILQQRVHGKPIVWLDNAATTQKPQAVIEAVSHYYAHDNSNIHRAAHTLAARSTDAFEGARQKVQKFIGAASPKEIVFVRGTTEAINLVAQTYGKKFLQPGDEIILSVLEHHANIVPWQMIAREKGAVIRVIPVNDRGEVMLDAYQSLLGPRTKIVSLAHANNSLGTLLPVAEMTQMAKRYGARVLIDGAQTIAHIPVDVQQMAPDFFVFSGHKVFAPTGVGVLWAKAELLEIMPPWQGGGSMIKNVTFEETTYSDPPAKFEAGTPSIADAVGLGAALDYLSQFGLPNVAKYEHELLGYATEQLSRIDGLRLIGTAREKVSVVSFILNGRSNEEVGRQLDQEGIAVRAGHHCAQPSLRRFGLESTVRPSLSLYNTHEEIDRLADAIRKIQLR